MFIAREKELKLLDEIMSKPTGSVMIYGKRKVGKTTLITHALENSKDATIYYECIKSTMEENIEGFVTVLVRENVLPVALAFKSFTDVFSYLNTFDRTLNIVIDEYPYLKVYTKPETVDSIFQTIIDNHIGNLATHIFFEVLCLHGGIII